VGDRIADDVTDRIADDVTDREDYTDWESVDEEEPQSAVENSEYRIVNIM
jgi:hypothetical protein